MSGDKSAKKYNIIKAASWYTIGNIFVKGISFFLLPVFTSLLSTYEYGIYGTFNSYLAIVEVIVLFGLSATVSIAKYSSDIDFEEYMNSILIIPSVITLLIAIIINGSFINNELFLGLGQTIWNCILVCALSTALLGVVSAKLIIEGRYAAYIAYSVGMTILDIGVSLFLCYTIFRTHDMHMARIIGKLIPGIIYALLYTSIFIKKKIVRKVTFFKAISLGFPLLLHTSSTVMLTQTDRLLIKFYDGYESVGIYTIAATFMTIPLVIYTSLNNSWVPWFYDHLDKKEYKSICTLNKAYLLLFLGFVIEFILVSPEIVFRFTDEDYWDSIYSLIPLTFSVVFDLLYTLVCNVEYYYKKAWLITSGTLVALVINIALDIVLIKQFGYIGAAYGTMMSKFALFAFHWIASKRIDPNDVIEFRHVLLVIVAVIVVDYLVTTSIYVPFIRYIIFIIIAVLIIGFIYNNKRMIISKIKEK